MTGEGLARINFVLEKIAAVEEMNRREREMKAKAKARMAKAAGRHG